MSVPLKKLIQDMPATAIFGETNIDIEKIEYHSSKVKAGDMFVAIRGYKLDGHDFIPQAMKNRASCIVAEDKKSYQACATILVEDSRLALAHLSDKFYDSPSTQLEVIGITGTNGKTTTSYLLRSILETKEKKTGLIGTIAHYIGEQKLSAYNTTPESLDLQRMFHQMLKEGIKYVVMEVSSHSLALRRVENVDFDVAIFTNLTWDHLDFHQDMDSYKKAKARLFEMLRKKQDKAVINLDDPNWSYFYKKTPVPKITYSLKNPQADIFVEKVDYSPNGTRMNISTPLGKSELKMNLIGEQNTYNTLSSVGGAVALNFDLEDIKSGLEKTKSVPGRLERINRGQPFDILIDYAHTPDALQRVLTTAKKLASGRVLVLFGCGGDRDKTKRSIMGEIASRIADYVIVTSDNPRSENPDSILDDIFKGITRKDNIERITDRREATSQAMNLAKPKDIVVIAGKGHEDYQIIGTQRLSFSDKKTVEGILEEMGYKADD